MVEDLTHATCVKKAPKQTGFILKCHVAFYYYSRISLISILIQVYLLLIFIRNIKKIYKKSKTIHKIAGKKTKNWKHTLVLKSLS